MIGVTQHKKARKHPVHRLFGNLQWVRTENYAAKLVFCKFMVASNTIKLLEKPQGTTAESLKMALISALELETNRLALFSKCNL